MKRLSVLLIAFGLILPIANSEAMRKVVYSKREKLLNQMSIIRLENVDFKDAALTDALEYLEAAYAKWPQTKSDEENNVSKNLNVILITHGESPTDYKVNLHLKDVSMLAVINYLCEMFDLQYDIQDNTMALSRHGGQMITRMYEVCPGIFSSLLSPGSNGNGAKSLEELFSKAGVVFPQNASVLYLPEYAKLIAHNTESNLVQLEKLLEVVNCVPFQVEIIVRVVECLGQDSPIATNGQFSAEQETKLLANGKLRTICQFSTITRTEVPSSVSIGTQRTEGSQSPLGTTNLYVFFSVMPSPSTEGILIQLKVNGKIQFADADLNAVVSDEIDTTLVIYDNATFRFWLNTPSSGKRTQNQELTRRYLSVTPRLISPDGMPLRTGSTSTNQETDRVIW